VIIIYLLRKQHVQPHKACLLCGTHDLRSSRGNERGERVEPPMIGMMDVKRHEMRSCHVRSLRSKQGWIISAAAALLL
jgi:hypothetical protein